MECDEAYIGPTEDCRRLHRIIIITIIITDISQLSISEMRMLQSVIKFVYVMGQVFPCSSVGD